MSFTKTSPFITLLLLTILLITTFTATIEAQLGPDEPNQATGLFGLPKFGNGVGSGRMGGGGFGFSFGGPNGGFSKAGVFGSSTVCLDQGPCYMQKITCLSECFKSFSNSGNGFGYGGGGGGCNFDCTSSCTATC
ncbi:hypothetical protein RND81_10G031700 [Saponaria officinalis]|uniref:Uncharacterized protein n=1 Tax=Saponaria officinalis TaxID=3572 RepID=A0AAW1HY84_SAPOF